MLETIKLIGALSGILSLAWNIWERMLRDRPEIDVGSGDTGPIITVCNPTKYTMIVRAFEVAPPLYAINEIKIGQELELAQRHALQIVRKQLPTSDRDVVLAPGVAKKFQLTAHEDDVVVTDDIKIATIWRYSHNRAAWFHPRIVRTIPVKSIKALKLESVSE